jgi:hypothetical protein
MLPISPLSGRVQLAGRVGGLLPLDLQKPRAAEHRCPVGTNRRSVQGFYLATLRALKSEIFFPERVFQLSTLTLNVFLLQIQINKYTFQAFKALVFFGSWPFNK